MKEALPFIRGIAFGLIYSLLDFRLLELNLAKSVKMNSEAAKKYIFSRYIFRYTLTGVIIYVSITNPKIHVMGTIIGLLILKLVIYLSSLFSKNKDSR
ncbi:MAG: ATP synthase subunit I [Clostridiales bacterium]|nr:ATP synthase subunit I [Clostridiales bacterium]